MNNKEIREYFSNNANDFDSILVKLLDRNEELEKSLDALDKPEIESFEFEHNGWVLNNITGVIYLISDTTPNDSRYFTSGMTFKTRQATENYREVSFKQRVLFHAAEKFNPDGWEAEGAHKRFYIYKEGISPCLFYYPEVIYFASEEIAQQAIKYCEFHMNRKRPWEE